MRNLLVILVVVCLSPSWPEMVMGELKAFCFIMMLEEVYAEPIPVPSSGIQVSPPTSRSAGLEPDVGIIRSDNDVPSPTKSVPDKSHSEEGSNPPRPNGDNDSESEGDGDDDQEQPSEPEPC